MNEVDAKKLEKFDDLVDWLDAVTGYLYQEAGPYYGGTIRTATRLVAEARALQEQSK